MDQSICTYASPKSQSEHTIGSYIHNLQMEGISGSAGPLDPCGTFDWCPFRTSEVQRTSTVQYKIIYSEECFPNLGLVRKHGAALNIGHRQLRAILLFTSTFASLGRLSVMHILLNSLFLAALVVGCRGGSDGRPCVQLGDTAPLGKYLHPCDLDFLGGCCHFI